MISFVNVKKVYNNGSQAVVALDGISFDIIEGDFVCLVGKSGAGKSTLIRLLVGEEKPTTGEIFFGNINMSKLRPLALQKVRRKIGVVYQDYKLLFRRTVYENLSYIMQVIGASDKIIVKDVPQVLELVGLEDKMKNFPHQLSGGEKQRLAIARALIHRPQIIVADEPTGNLDLYNTYEILNLIKRINSMGTTVVLATHDKEIIDQLKKRVITLDKGKIICDDPLGKFIL